MRFVSPPIVALALAIPTFAQTHVAPTDPLSPEDERKSFKLPPGFEAQLVAAEPDIGKPIQMAFDAKGRLWVTTSRHYPFPAAEGKASDKLYVLSEIGPNGRAKKVTVFADDLNIPIGILPLPDCNSCLVSECGRIVKLTDTDGDGKADKRETILEGFGYRDTHGMTNSFMLLPDGWVYATHGYANESVVKAKDGSEVRMHSGNTYRFRPDGSRIEHWTFGQVNPFGMCIDPWLNLYTADCHTKPITQLIRGAYYDSFGKPHDGLGYAPHVTRHDHGSTALCGLAWYEADHFPQEWKGCMFLGNVTANRVNVNKIEWRGSTPVAKELPDFLVSSDPWFRPTDIQLGPDGALYVADFYNRIIGHYEVDLRHPGRDRDRGRVWRVVFVGGDVPGRSFGKAPPPHPLGDITSNSAEELAMLVADKNLTIRLLAAQQIVARFPTLAAKLFPPIEPLAARDRLTDTDPHIKISAITTLIAHPHTDNIVPLVALIQKCPPEDTHLRHAARVALRNALRDTRDGWTAAEKADPEVIGDVAVGVHTKEAAAYVLHQVQAGRTEPRFCEHVGRYGDDELAAAAVATLKEKMASVFAVQALVRGLQARGGKIPPGTAAVAEAACVRALERPNAPTLAAAADLAGGLKITNLFEPFARFASGTGRSENERATALVTLMQIDPVRAAPVLGKTLTDPSSPAGLRERAAAALADSNEPAAREALLAALSTAPARLAVAIATGLASSPQGGATLLDAVRNGKASPRLLQEKGVADRLALHDRGKFKPQVSELTKGLAPVEERIDDLIRNRADRFRKARPNAELGKKAFAQHCASCHQIGGEGQKVGPQLDGIGSRGVERLLEDILDPGRNVDAEFRATVLDLADGRTLTGLLLREEGQVLVIADANGKEVRVPQKDIDRRTTTALSPMPANFDTAIPEVEFYHLLAYLLQQRAKD
jgi:putative heme-binding domain-containing protein